MDVAFTATEEAKMVLRDKMMIKLLTQSRLL